MLHRYTPPQLLDSEPAQPSSLPCSSSPPSWSRFSLSPTLQATDSWGVTIDAYADEASFAFGNSHRSLVETRHRRFASFPAEDEFVAPCTFNALPDVTLKH